MNIKDELRYNSGERKYINKCIKCGNKFSGKKGEKKCIRCK